MKNHHILILMVAAGVLLQAQERKVPKDSTRISVIGCAKGRSLTSMPRATAEPVSGAVEPGRRFRLSGPKKLLAEIRAKETQRVEVTGIVKVSQLSPATQGVPLGKSGRIRLGGGPPNRDPTQVDPSRDPLFNETVLDVESWRVLPESCPAN